MSLAAFSAILAGLVVLAIFWLLRSDRLPVMHSVWWLCVAAIIGFLGLFPRAIDVAAAWVGVAYSPSLLFITAILVLLIKVLLEDVDVSRDRRRLLRVAQKVAMLEERLEQLETSERQTGPKD